MSAASGEVRCLQRARRRMAAAVAGDGPEGTVSGEISEYQCYLRS